MSYHEEPGMPIGECVQKECFWNIQHYDRIKNYGDLMVRVARADDGHIYVSTTEYHQNYLDDTITWLNPFLGILQWQKFVHNNKKWRSQ